MMSIGRWALWNNLWHPRMSQSSIFALQMMTWMCLFTHILYMPKARLRERVGALLSLYYNWTKGAAMPQSILDINTKQPKTDIQPLNLTTQAKFSNKMTPNSNLSRVSIHECSSSWLITIMNICRWATGGDCGRKRFFDILSLWWCTTVSHEKNLAHIHRLSMAAPSTTTDLPHLTTDTTHTHLLTHAYIYRHMHIDDIHGNPVITNPDQPNTRL